ncbi:glycosyltransferase [Azonexus sp.]|uniref:glycosyltransferase n=1 Tax=Azonexus sp. TaxID=1872668 RepID=UPI0035B0C866
MVRSGQKILFFNVNGSGLGHMNRCLSYARRLRGRAQPVFFSLASAIEVIEEMGFEADYFVSPYWSDTSSYAWNSELAVRFGMMLERVRPAAVVFDGTWPFQGFLAACREYGGPLRIIWSNRGFLKADAARVPVPEGVFDLVIVPGELGAGYEESLQAGVRKIQVPPVGLLDDDELLGREAARQALGLPASGRLALFSLGPGNLKDVSGIGHSLIRDFEAEGFQVVWTRAPISVRDVELPAGVLPLSVYPLVRYLRAFDVFVGAAGYNTCCEVVQAGVPTLLVPNDQLADDQVRRAHLVAQHAPAVVSACESEAERCAALAQLLALPPRLSVPSGISLDGARLAADAILTLAEGGA